MRKTMRKKKPLKGLKIPVNPAAKWDTSIQGTRENARMKLANPRQKKKKLGREKP